MSVLWLMMKSEGRGRNIIKSQSGGEMMFPLLYRNFLVTSWTLMVRLDGFQGALILFLDKLECSFEKLHRSLRDMSYMSFMHLNEQENFLIWKLIFANDILTLGFYFVFLLWVATGSSICFGSVMQFYINFATVQVGWDFSS